MNTRFWHALLLCLLVAVPLANAAGYHNDMTDPVGWKPQVPGLDNPALDSALRLDGPATVFSVGTRNRGMAWRLELSPPVLDDQAFLVMRYKAERLNANRNDFAVLLEDIQGQKYPVLLTKDLELGGEWHVAVVDLTGEDVRLVAGLWIQVQASAQGNAYLAIDDIAFTNTLPAELGAHALERMGFVPDVQASTQRLNNGEISWQAQPSWLANPAQAYASARVQVEGIPGAQRFEITDAQRGMKWTASLGGRVDTTGFAYVTIKYRAENMLGASTGPANNEYLLWVAGKSTETGKSIEAMPITMGDIRDDGQWHTARGIVPAMKIDTMALHLQTDNGNALLEIESISFEAGEVKKSVLDSLVYRSGWDPVLDKDYAPISLTGHTLDLWETFKRDGYDSRWFENERITVTGGDVHIPFRVRNASPQLMGTDVAEVGTVSFAVNARVGTLYLLMGARFFGPEDPSLGGGDIKAVRTVERFVIEITYVDGSTEKLFPQTIRGAYEIGREFQVYAAVPAKDIEVATVTLHDEMRNGGFYLAGATIGHTRWDKAAFLRELPVSSLPGRSHVDPGEQNIRQVGQSVVFENSIMQLTLSLENQKLEVVSIKNRLTNAEILTSPTPLIELLPGKQRVDDLKVSTVHVDNAQVAITLTSTQMAAKLTGRFSPAGEVVFSLELENQSTTQLDNRVRFPALKNISIRGDQAPVQASDLWYMYPRRGVYIHNRTINASVPYSGYFPMQFMNFYNHDLGGMYIMTHDLDLTYKVFEIGKNAAGIGTLGIRYLDSGEEDFSPGSTLAFPDTVIGVHEGDWRAAFGAYTDWVATWYQPAAPRKDWFLNVFNFRQQFLHFGWPDKSGIYNELDRSFNFDQALERDAAAFGGIDYLHLFDWGWSPWTGRVGDYDPWTYLGTAERFRQALTDVSSQGLPVGLYLEGYLVGPQSHVGKTMGDEWLRLDANGQPYTNFAPEMNMCPHVQGWQDYLVQTYRRVWEQTGAQGFYIDQFGFSDTTKFCYADDHDHNVGMPPLSGEFEILSRVRQVLPPEVVIYTEESPVDVLSQYQDGSFTYNIHATSDDWSPHSLNLYRFAFPDFKTIEIIVVDKPLGSDYQSLKRVFFNGEGVWLMGTADKWFTPETLAFIRHMNQVLREHADAFSSMSPVPLYPTLVDGVYANAFPVDGAGSSKTVWTLYNSHYRTVETSVLAVPHADGATYHDAWNGGQLTPVIRDGMALLELKLDPRGVGAVVQQQGR